MAFELIRENIECEQLLGENFCANPVSNEYVIPDTYPDVNEILILDAKPSVLNAEVIQNKISLEGQIEYTVLYLTKEEEGTGIHSVKYMGKFSNDVNIPGAEYRMLCDTDCYVENMRCVIVNERKISVVGIIKSKVEVYKKYDFEVIKDVTGSQDIQMLKNPATIDKIVGTVSGDLLAKCQIQVPMEKPQIGNVLKCNVNVHKKDVKVMEGKVSVEAYAHVTLLYRGKDTTDIVCLENDVMMNKEIEYEGVNPIMDNYTNFKVDGLEYNLKEDDLGENRIVDIEALIKSNTKIIHKEEIDIIEDAYSPSSLMNITKKDYELNVMHGHNYADTIVKSTIELDNSNPKASQIVMSNGNVCVTNKKLVEDKIIVEGLLEAEVLYRSNNEEKGVCLAKEEIPFNCTIEIPGCKIDMQCIAKAVLEKIEASVEVNTISVKAVVQVYGRVNYITHKEFLVDINPLEGELPIKKSSLTIYVVQHGDTLWKIAKKYSTTVDDLIKLNAIEESDAVRVGYKLIIPGRAII